MSRKHINFDEYRAEKAKETIKITAFGNEYELPGSPKVAIIERLMELKKKSGKEAFIPEEQIIVMVKELIGEEDATQLIKEGITVEELEWLLKQIWSVYSPGSGDETKNTSTSQNGGEK